MFIVLGPETMAISVRTIAQDFRPIRAGGLQLLGRVRALAVSSNRDPSAPHPFARHFRMNSQYWI